MDAHIYLFDLRQFQLIFVLLQVMTNQEACDCIKDIDDAKKASKKLIKEALSKGSYDDISCIVVMF